MKDETYLTVKELAERMRVTPATVRYWVYAGKAPRSIRPARLRLFPLSEVRKWEQQREVPGEPAA